MQTTTAPKIPDQDLAQTSNGPAPDLRQQGLACFAVCLLAACLSSEAEWLKLGLGFLLLGEGLARCAPKSEMKGV